jgi:hypothetical protein
MAKPARAKALQVLVVLRRRNVHVLCRQPRPVQDPGDASDYDVANAMLVSTRMMPPASSSCGEPSTIVGRCQGSTRRGVGLLRHPRHPAVRLEPSLGGLGERIAELAFRDVIQRFEPQPQIESTRREYSVERGDVGHGPGALIASNRRLRRSRTSRQFTLRDSGLSTRLPQQ